jgi:hypothetical protein
MESVLHILDELPLLTPDQRMYVSDDGVFRIDSYYMGCVGRSVLNLVVGGYNRTTIVRSLQTFLRKVLDTATDAAYSLNTPYVIGNFRTYGLESGQTKENRGYLQKLSTDLEKVRVLIGTLTRIYITDKAICRQLNACSADISTIQEIVSPWKVIR